jgi:hypothetical protein
MGASSRRVKKMRAHEPKTPMKQKVSWLAPLNKAVMMAAAQHTAQNPSGKNI